MLSKSDITNFWNNQQEYTIKGSGRSIEPFSRKIVLYDSNTYRVYAACTYIATASASFGFNSEYAFTYAEWNNKKYNDIWKWKRSTNNTWVNDENFDTIAELEQTILLNQKCFALDIMHSKIELSNQWNLGYGDQQASIYMAKYLEAKEFLKLGLTEDDDCEYPYVTAYARLRNITPVESATLIKLQYNIKNSFLAEQENLRIKYTHLLLEQTDLKSLNNVFEKFLTEYDKYGSI